MFDQLSGMFQMHKKLKTLTSWSSTHLISNAMNEQKKLLLIKTIANV